MSVEKMQTVEYGSNKNRNNTCLSISSHLQNNFPDTTTDDSLVYKGLHIFYAIVIEWHRKMQAELFLLFWNSWWPDMRANGCKPTIGMVY